MLLCQHQIDLQPHIDPHENVDWTRASQFYSNLAEIPSFVSSHRQSGNNVASSISSVDPQLLQGRQLQVYNTIVQHLENNGESLPLYMIVSGTAGTGKSYIINCLKILLQERLRVAAPTGVASYNIEGYTLHSLFNLPTKADFKDYKEKSFMKCKNH